MAAAVTAQEFDSVKVSVEFFVDVSSRESTMRYVATAC
jgi:hypothetical protein